MLGETQEAVLRALEEHEKWHERCGWVWNSASGTRRILESLYKRKLVRRRPGPHGVTYYPIRRK